MPTLAPSSTTPRERDFSSDVAELLYRSLERAISSLARSRHSAEISIRRRESEVPEEVRFLVECGGCLQMLASLTANPVGNARDYTVCCTVEEGPTRRFTYSRPSSEALSRAPYLGREVARFLLDELEREIGRRLLLAIAPPTEEDS